MFDFGVHGGGVAGADLSLVSLVVRRCCSLAVYTSKACVLFVTRVEVESESCSMGRERSVCCRCSVVAMVV